MAKVEKEKVVVKGVSLTLHEKKIYDLVVEKGVVNYKDIVDACDGNTKSAIATLARLNKTHGLLKKNEPVKLTTYEIVKEV